MMSVSLRSFTVSSKTHLLQEIQVRHRYGLKDLRQTHMRQRASSHVCGLAQVDVHHMHAKYCRVQIRVTSSKRPRSLGISDHDASQWGYLELPKQEEQTHMFTSVARCSCLAQLDATMRPIEQPQFPEPMIATFRGMEEDDIFRILFNIDGTHRPLSMRRARVE
jgi:hypothetical protein